MVYTCVHGKQSQATQMCIEDFTHTGGALHNCTGVKDYRYTKQREGARGTIQPPLHCRGRLHLCTRKTRASTRMRPCFTLRFSVDQIERGPGAATLVLST